LVRPERAERFRTALSETGLDPSRVLVHAGYVINAASPDPVKHERSARALAREVERTATLGAFACCFHPGSAGTDTVENAIARIADAMVNALEESPGTTRILVENTAGAGKTIGRTPEEVAAILS